MKHDPRELGAKCDQCPLGPNGCLREGPWRPVPSEVHSDAAIAAVLEAPKDADVDYGRPLAGEDGFEWNNALAAVRMKRPHVDLFHVIQCQPPKNWKRMEARLRRARKTLTKSYQTYDEMSATEAKRKAEEELPHPVDCCKPRLQRELVNYECIIPLGGTAGQTVLNTSRTLSSLEGDMVEVSARRLFWDAFDWTQTDDNWPVKVITTYDPGVVKHKPKLRPQMHASLGKALRWFNDMLNWREPEILLQPTPEELEKWLAVDSPYWVYDVETDGINVMDIGVDCLAIATPDLNEHGEPAMPWEKPARLARVVGIHLDYLLINHARPDQRVRAYSSEASVIRDILTRFFLDESKKKVGHNAGYFDRMAIECVFGVTPTPCEDTLFDARFAYPDLPKGLKPTGRRETDVHKWETSESGEDSATSREEVKDRLIYCCYDTAVNARIQPPLRVKADHNGANRPLPDWAKHHSWDSARPWTLRELDHARQDMCVQMHKNGVYVDQGMVSDLTTQFEKLSATLYDELQDLCDAVGLRRASAEELDEFNPGSYHQIRDLLYEKWDLGCPYGMDPKDFYTDTGLPGTGDAVLRGHMASFEPTSVQYLFLEKLRQYRRIRNKVLGTQLYKMVPLSEGGVLHPDGRVRSSWNSHTTAVGRLSSSGPNMQNQSSRKDIGGVRRIYRAAPGNVLVGCDLDQAHLRITANYWKVERLIECFLAEKDPHCWLAHDLFGKDFENAPGWANGFSLRQSEKPNKKKRAGLMRELAKTYRYACAVADTQVVVLGAEEHKRIADIVPGQDWTWCWDGGQYAPTKVIQKTRVGIRRCLKLTMKDKRKTYTEVFTADHRFMLRDGTYRELQDLRPGDRLMPFKRWVHPNTGYRYLDQHNDNSRVLEHTWVLPGHEVVHHKDECKANNHPDNLEGMTASAHAKHHWTDERAARQSGRSKQMWTNDKEAVGSRLAEGRRNSKTWREAVRKAAIENLKKRKRTNKGRTFKSKFDKYRDVIGHISDSEVAKMAGGTKEGVAYYRKKRGIPAYWRGETDLKPNHVVVSIEEAGEHEVWDIAVDHESSNFALASGVFVHNSIYWASPETKHGVIRSTEQTYIDDDGRLKTRLPYLDFDLLQVRFFDDVWHSSEPHWKMAWKDMLDLFDKQGWMEEPLFGRRSGTLSGGKKNEVVNFPILACESAAMAVAEQRVLHSFPFQKWGPGTGLVAQVHDSMIVEVPERLAEWARDEMTRCMTIHVPGWEVPFTCEADIGYTWAEV